MAGNIINHSNLSAAMNKSIVPGNLPAVAHLVNTLENGDPSAMPDPHKRELLTNILQTIETPSKRTRADWVVPLLIYAQNDAMLALHVGKLWLEKSVGLHPTEVLDASTIIYELLKNPDSALFFAHTLFAVRTAAAELVKSRSVENKESKPIDSEEEEEEEEENEEEEEEDEE